jgi:NAD(P)H-flavin reductase
MHQGILSEREPVGGALLRVRLSVEPSVAATHTRHGQFVEVRHDLAPEGPVSNEATIPAAVRGAFALASPPGSSTWDFLMKEGGAVTERVLTLDLGARVKVSAAQGHGFPLEEAKGRPLVLAVTGGGIAAVLTAAGARLEDGAAARTYLLYGVRERGDVALEPELAAFRSAGMEVAICLSREHIHESGFFRGYVQQVARERKWMLTNGLVFAAGNKEMVAGVRQAAPDLGLRPEDVRVNG